MTSAEINRQTHGQSAIESGTIVARNPKNEPHARPGPLPGTRVRSGGSFPGRTRQTPTAPYTVQRVPCYTNGWLPVPGWNEPDKQDTMHMSTSFIPMRAAPALAALALLACATPGPPMPPLSGSRWVLVAIESMDDAQPTVRPADASRYALDFRAQGQASLQLDCNRGSGTWQATPSAQAEPGWPSGSLVFGPIATTRAICPPGSLAPRLERALPYVRSYLLKDGLLHLSLMADGGILSWKPAP